MTHLRKRACESILSKDLTYSPCVGLLGMRQVGKTTLLKKYAADYRSFDVPEMTSYFEREGLGLLQATRKTLALDEVQKYPPVFDMLKHAIDSFKKPGRFFV